MRIFIQTLSMILIAVVFVSVSLLSLTSIEATAQENVHLPHDPINESYILIDDFKDGNWINKLGGKNECFSFEQGGGQITCEISATLEYSYVEMAYDVITDSANVWLQMGLGQAGSYGNFLAMDAIWLVIKGESGGEKLYAEFKNCGLPEESDYPKVEIDNYLIGGITTSWRAVVIPFSAFTNKLNDEQRKNWSWSCLDRFTIIAHHDISSGKGKVFIDDVRAIASTVLVDDFHDTEFENELGGTSGPWASITTTAIITPDYLNQLLRLTYDVPDGDVAGGYWTKILSTNMVSQKDYLSFYIRGERGNEELSIEVKDCGTNGYQHFPEIKISDYLAKGITTSLQQVIIPLEAFVTNYNDSEPGVDWNCIEQISFNVSGREQFRSGQGVVYIDDVTFIPANAFPYRLPVFIDHFHDCNHKNALNWTWYTDTGSSTMDDPIFEVMPDPEHRRGDYGCGYRFTYDVRVTPQVQQSAWAWSELKGFNSTNYTYLEFYIKGRDGGESTRLYLADRQNKQDFETIEDITTSWQRRLIPLSEFSLVDLTNLRELKIAFESGNRKGEIYIDDLSFVKPWIALPLIQKPEIITPMTELSIFNDNTGGDVTVIVSDPNTNDVVTTCTVPNNQTLPCGDFLPGTYKVEASATCGVAFILKTFSAGPEITRVFCQQ